MSDRLALLFALAILAIDSQTFFALPAQDAEDGRSLSPETSPPKQAAGPSFGAPLSFRAATNFRGVADSGIPPPCACSAAAPA